MAQMAAHAAALRPTHAANAGRRAFRLLLCSWALLSAAPVLAQDAPIVAELRVEEEGRLVTDPEVLALIETAVGQPFSMQSVKESQDHLNTLNRFDDIQVIRDDVPGGIRVTYQLVPRRPIDRTEFRGTLGLDKGDLEREIREQYGAAPPESRVDQATERLRTLYRDHGYPSARITADIVNRADAFRRTLVLSIEAGPRALIKRIEWDLDEAAPPEGVSARPSIREGRTYDADQIRRALDRYVTDLREKGFYESAAQLGTPSFEADGAVVPIFVRRGRRVRIVWAGDPIPQADQDRLVPVEQEASVDETLLENWTLAIESDLRAQGFKDASVQRASSGASAPELTITFTITKGPRYVVSGIAFSGQTDRTELELHGALGIKEGEPFVQAALDEGASRIRAAYEARGFNSASVKADFSVVTPELPVDGMRRVRIAVAIDEGVREVVRSIGFDGNASTPDSRLLGLVTVSEGEAFWAADLLRSRENILIDYLDRGYLDVNVPVPLLSREDSQVDILFRVTEGPQVVVDRIVIDGNQRTSRRTIERELQIKEGEPLGERLRLDSEARLRELGLFRRVRIDVRRHRSDSRADAIVVVAEADPSMIGGGGGLEISSRLRATQVVGEESLGLEERIEVAPRAFFEIGRRNMGGKNRSINLFTRVSAKSEDTVLENGIVESSYGVNEYRVFATYREPKLFATPVNILLTGIAERAIRPSYSFETREGRAEVFGTLSSSVSGAVRFSIEQTDVESNVPPEQAPLIDRLFPDVRLSKVSGSLVRNTRDDDLNPSRGTFLSADAEFAARALGSEVAYVKGLIQGVWYRKLPVRQRTVFVLRGILGAARGAPRDAVKLDPGGGPVLDLEGNPIVESIVDLPASERFFAGGSTTNRGFSDDRLGDEGTITPEGYPLGGNGEVILNGEVRVGITRIGNDTVAGVAFVDAGNVFKLASDISLMNLRPAAGFGVHYYWRLLPVRVELGFNLDRRELAPGSMTFERGHVLHISLGPAF
jgi:outer membrane protein assembly complex protein YaeT